MISGTQRRIGKSFIKKIARKSVFFYGKLNVIVGAAHKMDTFVLKWRTTFFL